MEAGKVRAEGDTMRAVDLIDAMIVAADAQRTATPRSTEMERSACPTCGSCSGMFTANSMNCLMEALGLALPGNGTLVATHADRKELFLEAGRTHRGSGPALVRAGRRHRPAARHRHLRRLRERHDARHRHGRLDQHRAAPAGRRAGSRRAVHHARHRPAVAAGAQAVQGGALGGAPCTWRTCTAPAASSASWASWIAAG